MYLEISSRRTGKSTRLIESVYAWFMINPFCRKAVIICPTHHQAKMLQDFARLNYGSLFASNDVFFMGCNESESKISELAISLKPGEELRGFYDEFDFASEVILNPSWYYSTTPSRKRGFDEILYHRLNGSDDALMTLIDMNRGKYESKTILSELNNLSIGVVKGFMNYLPKESWDGEMYARWY